MALLAFGPAGCNGYFAVPAQLSKLDEVARLEGRVEVPEWKGQALWVGLSEVSEGSRSPDVLRDRQRLVRPGPFRFDVAHGLYRVSALEDANDNGRYDRGERWTVAGAPEPLLLGPGEVRSDLVLRIERSAPQRRAQPFPERVEPRRALGEITSLSDLRFRKETGPLGMWTPVRFLEEVGTGIFFLEPYNPSLLPVLFVHGISGYPQEFDALIDALDPERFQAWVLHYPSGLSLDQIALHLVRDLDVLWAKIGFDRVCVVAHSMGGLVVRKAAGLHRMQHLSDGGFLDLIVALAAPFAGLESAGIGVRLSPFVLPVWLDLDPSGRFVRDLFSSRLPESTRLRLIVSHSGGSGRNVVPLESQLRAEALVEAEHHMRGFVASHSGLLEDPNVIDVVVSLLDDCGRLNEARGCRPSAGRCRPMPGGRAPAGAPRSGDEPPRRARASRRRPPGTGMLGGAHRGAP